MSTSVPEADATAQAQGKSYNSGPRDSHIWIPMTTIILITLPSSKQLPSPRRERVTHPSDIDATSGKSGHTALLIPYSQMATKENKAKRYLSMQTKRLASMWPATCRQHQCVFSACVHTYVRVCVCVCMHVSECVCVCVLVVWFLSSWLKYRHILEEGLLTEKMTP